MQSSPIIARKLKIPGSLFLLAYSMRIDLSTDSPEALPGLSSGAAYGHKQQPYPVY
jgi:hypothetical protein